MNTISEVFSDEFIENLSETPEIGVTQICDKLLSSVDEESQWVDSYDLLLEALAILEIYSARYSLGLTLPKIGTDSNRGEEASRIGTYFHQLKEKTLKILNKTKYENLKENFQRKLGGKFLYEFSQGDFDRVQTLTHELRKLISSSSELNKEYKMRLLARLERFQQELHKKMSNLDRCWGLIGEAGIALGKFGNDAKPFLDYIKEIAQIVWATQARAEELPSGSKPPIQLPEPPSQSS